MTTYIAPDPSLNWPICRAAVDLIAQAEGLRLQSYQDVAGVWTIGRGHAQGVQPNETWTLARADEVFCRDLTAFAREVRAMLAGCPTSDNELGAMVSLAYNIGAAAFARSTVLKAHRAGNRAAAARAFNLWNLATINGRKVEVAGLVRRRAQEAALYLTPPTPSVGFADSSLKEGAKIKPPSQREVSPPQAVTEGVQTAAIVPESTAPASPIHQSGALSLISGGLGMAAAASGDVRTLAENLHINLGAVCAAVSLVVGAVVIYWRWRQRREGWA